MTLTITSATTGFVGLSLIEASDFTDRDIFSPGFLEKALIYFTLLTSVGFIVTSTLFIYAPPYHLVHFICILSHLSYQVHFFIKAVQDSAPQLRNF